MNSYKTADYHGSQYRKSSTTRTTRRKIPKHQKKHRSYGLIPYCITYPTQPWVLLVQHRHGHHWGFPKGYRKQTESPLKTATREFTEETGLSSDTFIHRPIHNWKIRQSYPCQKRGVNIRKVVWLYPTCLDITQVPRNLKPSNEIISCRWFTLQDAFYALTHQESRDALLRFAHDLHHNLRHDMRSKK